jgi:hypothetical protein
VICSTCFRQCRSLRAVAFESNAHLVEISDGAFGQCFSLQSISFPASVQVLRKRCFEWSPLSSITFDRGGICLSGCSSGKLGDLLCMVLPTHCIITLSALAFESSLLKQAICFSVPKVDSSCKSEIRSLSESSFADCDVISSVIFESNPELVHICEYVNIYVTYSRIYVDM